VTTTPKPHWAHADVVGRLHDALNLPVGFDTDVNGAALGEHRWGAAQGLDTFVYLTIGTGLGGGGMVNGRLLHGLMHSEMGHMRIPHDLARDPYPGQCTYHGDCWEGLGVRAGHRGALADEGAHLAHRAIRRGRWKRITWRSASSTSSQRSRPSALSWAAA
jgi:predicted NBD/HSP70 family sugar kinase